MVQDMEITLSGDLKNCSGNTDSRSLSRTAGEGAGPRIPVPGEAGDRGYSAATGCGTGGPSALISASHGPGKRPRLTLSRENT
jgi:hypothetical protein